MFKEVKSQCEMNLCIFISKERVRY